MLSTLRMFRLSPVSGYRKYALFFVKDSKSHLNNIHVTNQYPSMRWPIGAANEQMR